MGKKSKIVFLILLGLITLAVFTFLLYGKDIPVLDPQGTIAGKQRDLIVIATLLMLIVVIPVYILTFAIAWRYRAGNKKAKYSPNLDGNRWAEAVWWGVPMIIIAVLAVMTWTSSHELDPFKPIKAEKKSVKIQVVALQWRWLFIYPEQNIASVNFVQFPVDTPINFDITSDAPMNSFWIPSLGGQIYAMSGMTTKLHLIADHTGTFRGSSANISGEGFSGMSFHVQASKKSDFNNWVKDLKNDKPRLGVTDYIELARPNTEKKTLYYGSVDDGLYDTVIDKYTNPALQKTGEYQEGMDH